MSERCCESCVFWDDNNGKLTGGICRRFPPLMNGWPATKNSDKCGEWKENTNGERLKKALNKTKKQS